jgi:hypothetical protein
VGRKEPVAESRPVFDVNFGVDHREEEPLVTDDAMTWQFATGRACYRRAAHPFLALGLIEL